MRLQGKQAIVTGAGSGIGQAVAALFLREGATVLGVDRDVAGVPEGCARFEADVIDETAAEAAVAGLPGVDVLVTAAGISLGKPAAETAWDGFQGVMAVNVGGTFLWIRACLRPMLAQKRGSIVTIASQLARAGGRNNAAYVASKGAVTALTRSVAVDYANAGIRCNTVLPGAIRTPMLARSFARNADPAAIEAASRARHPMGRFGQAEEVAQSVLHLASDESSFVTGIELPVDGGWLAG